MRITKSLMLTALFALVLGTASANTSPEEKTARKEIKTWIQKAKIFSEIKEDMTVHVTFTVNDKNEIIVTSTDQEKLDKTIKSTLNYKKLESTDIQINKTYTLPVILKKY
ncbi:MAG: hypothetical protein P1U56_17635 [Saprospiraceae bacterium]|nr:hypothetical protein [Saprospiraceae bacterium]